MYIFSTRRISFASAKARKIAQYICVGCIVVDERKLKTDSVVFQSV